MKIVAFAASSSENSINKQLVTYAAGLLNEADVEILDLNDYELPLFSVDKEAELGSPELAAKFYEKLGSCDAIMISFAEHNGSYSAAYKNLFDWCSRINQKLFQNKPMVMLATSPGARGAQTVLATAVGSASYFAGDVKASVSVPSFQDNFDSATGAITNAELAEEIKAAVQKLVA
ncbi:MAG: NAD(P)H-dependent oxidoreductase [Aureliella sp.]